MNYRKRSASGEAEGEWKVWIVLLSIACVLASLGCFLYIHYVRPEHSGPKLVEADGITYIACGGAIWVRNEGNEKNPYEETYYVLFKDSDGNPHELKQVRLLAVKDLPRDTPACKTRR